MTRRPNLIADADRWFWPRVDRSGGPDACWLWQGPLMADGYGKVKVSNKWLLSHRVAWLLTHDDLPPQLNHTCNVPACCNPSHLYSGTQRDNVADSIKAGTFYPSTRTRKEERP